MRILMVTMNDSKGLTLAETLSKSHNITVLHPGEIDFECPFNEHEIIEELNTFVFDGFDAVIYIASESLPCRILTSVLRGVKNDLKTKCICIAEMTFDSSCSSECIPERLICKGISDQMQGRLSFWTVSPLYGEDFLPETLMQSISGRIKNNRIIIPGAEDDFFDLLHVADLAEALDKYIRLQECEPEIVLTSGQSSPLKELVKVLKNHAPQVNIEYTGAAVQKTEAMLESSFTGWTPKHSFSAELPDVIQLIEREGAEILTAERGYRSKILTRILSFLGVFALVCLYTSFIRTSSELQFVDVRLLFVISACIFWGSKYGLSAAILCSAASVIQSIASGTQWYVIFFHIDNWIPITVYLACAVLFGMYKDNQPST